MIVGVGCELGVCLADQVAGLVINETAGIAVNIRHADGPVGGIVLIGGFGTDNIAAGRRIAAGAGGGRVTRVNGIPGVLLVNLAVAVINGFLNPASGFLT
jgi:hypothetical protein